ncbi:MAG: hypothetical protein PWP34_2047 [Desulfuromonadales bacterium]|jgi:hypothetical protein|nr:hypothetical protein [Desulfuromonadales bacterium]
MCLHPKADSLVPVRKPGMDTARFSYGKRAIFPRIEEVKHLRGSVDVWDSQAGMRIDAEIGGKVRLPMNTGLECGSGRHIETGVVS